MQSIRHIIDEGAAEEDLQHPETGRRGGDDEHNSDEGNEGQ